MRSPRLCGNPSQVPLHSLWCPVTSAIAATPQTRATDPPRPKFARVNLEHLHSILMKPCAASEYLIHRVHPPHSTAAPAAPPRNGDGSAMSRAALRGSASRFPPRITEVP